MKISLSDIKRHLNIDDEYTADDALIEGYYLAAVAAVLSDCDFTDEEMAYDD